MILNKQQIKFKKHSRLVNDSLNEQEKNGEVDAVFDGYEIHSSLITWALLNISTKKLKALIEKNK